MSVEKTKEEAVPADDFQVEIIADDTELLDHPVIGG